MNGAAREYRFYQLTEDGHVATPARVWPLPNDDAAVRRAKLYIEDLAIEIWQGTRRVATIYPDPD